MINKIDNQTFETVINKIKGSSRFFVGWRTDRRNRKIANQGKKEVIVAVTVADSFSDLDLVVEAFELAGAD